jgi:hypothetical protein
VTAALRKSLILDLDGVGAGALQQPHRSLNVERIAVAGVGVDNQMSADTITDQLHRLDDLAHADETDVGAPKMRVCDACSGDVQRLEAGALGNQRGERIVHAGREQDWATLEPFRQGICSHVHNPK